MRRNKTIKRLMSLLHKKNSGGFTLVEVIVSCALLGVLLLGVMLFINPVFDMLKVEKQDAKASVVASSIENYITRSLRSTTHVKVFRNATYYENMENGVLFGNGTSTSGDSDLNEMRAFVDSNKDIYELRCISFTLKNDPKTGEVRYVMSQEYLNDAKTGLDLNYQVQVFDQCYYTGLYPKVAVGAVAKVDPETGNKVQKEDPNNPGSYLDVYHGIQISVNMYDSSIFEPNSLVFAGSGSTELFMVAMDDTKYHIYGSRNVREDDEVAGVDEAAMIISPGDSRLRTITDEKATCGTYIYYIARKYKPSTPAPVGP